MALHYIYSTEHGWDFKVGFSQSRTRRHSIPNCEAFYELPENSVKAAVASHEAQVLD